jgi:hypothetical protein
MSATIHLTPGEERKLREWASQSGQNPTAYVYPTWSSR